MFDFGIGSTELLVIVVVALLVVGPKDLPRLLRTIGNFVAKVRGLAREFQGHLDEAMRETGIDEVKDNVTKMKEFTVADLDKEFSELEKEFRDTALPEGGTAPDPGFDADGDLLDDTERPLPSLDGDAKEGSRGRAGTGRDGTSAEEAGDSPVEKEAGTVETEGASDGGRKDG